MDDTLQFLLDNFDQTVKVLRSEQFMAEERPQAKQSVRFGGHAYTDPKKKKYVKDLVKTFKAQYDGPEICGNIRLTVLYCFPWTQAEGAMCNLIWGLCGAHVDVDNLLKPLKDALKGVIMMDDSQVVDIRARKIRYPRGCIAVRIEEISPNRELIMPSPSV